jgi:hypothetical protein
MALFERLLGLRNDVGLLSEQYDPVAGRQLGNTRGRSALSAWSILPACSAESARALARKVTGKRAASSGADRLRTGWLERI